MKPIHQAEQTRNRHDVGKKRRRRLARSTKGQPGHCKETSADAQENPGESCPETTVSKIYLYPSNPYSYLESFPGLRGMAASTPLLVLCAALCACTLRAPPHSRHPQAQPMRSARQQVRCAAPDARPKRATRARATEACNAAGGWAGASYLEQLKRDPRRGLASLLQPQAGGGATSVVTSTILLI